MQTQVRLRVILQSVFLLFVTGYVGLVSQGIPFWDDDFTSWFNRIEGKSVWTVLLQCISPFSQDAKNWGYNDRPVQALVYQVSRLLVGYESWLVLVVKGLALVGSVVLIERWSKRLVPAGRGSWVVGCAAAALFVTAPGPLAAQIMIQDFAPVSTFIFLAVTYVIWGEIERTPLDWEVLNSEGLGAQAQRDWLARWMWICLLTVVGYRCKADIKMVPLIFGFYILILRPRQWKLFAVPLGIMMFWAVPWGTGLFSKLPPFVPGSQGSEVDWMWQPASLSRMLDFLWASGPINFRSWVNDAPLSLAGVFGPGLIGFVAVVAAVFLRWTSWQKDHFFVRPEDRARFFSLLWMLAALIAVSTLAGINETFRIRYGILTVVPACLIFASVGGMFLESQERFPKWTPFVVLLFVVLQVGININRSFNYRKSIGFVMTSVDELYRYVETTLPSDSKLALMPGFMNYQFRPDAKPFFKDKPSVGSTQDLARQFPPGKTYLMGWEVPFWEEIEVVGRFTGCSSTRIFDLLWGCDTQQATYLMRYVGGDSLFREADSLLKAGKLNEASAVYQHILGKYPGSQAARFVYSQIAYDLRDWVLMDRLGSELEQNFPHHPGVLYNHALALKELRRFGEAAERLERVVAQDQRGYGSLYNLYAAYKDGGETRKAKKILNQMKDIFPSDPEVHRLWIESDLH